MRKIHLRLPSAIVLCSIMLVAACNKLGGTQSGTAGGKGGSEASQVVARVNGEEITVHQLDAELANVPQAGQDVKKTQQEVLRAMVYRTLLRQAAVKAGLDKDPRVALLIDSARDKVLADVYLQSQTGTAPPPTQTEVDKYISDNPLQFGERRIYQFERLTMPSDQYSELLVPMFDQKETFKDFQDYLNGKTVPYTLTEVRLPSTDFPKKVQDQLAKFGVGDNIVVRGPKSVVILKIKGWVDMPLDQADSQKMAEAVLHQQSMQARASSLRDQMSNTAKVEFLGDFAGMTLAEPAPQASSSAAPATTQPPVAAPQPAAPAPAASGSGSGATSGSSGGGN